MGNASLNVYNLINYRAPILPLSNSCITALNRLMLIVSDHTNLRQLGCRIKEKVNHGC